MNVFAQHFAHYGVHHYSLFEALLHFLQTDFVLLVIAVSALALGLRYILRKT